MTRDFRIPAALACALLLAAPASGAPAPKPAAAAAKARRDLPPAVAASRRLEDVHIEGELEVPRVTFITVRQPHRFNDYTRATSVRPARRMAAETALPAWIPAADTAASEARKESRK